MKWTARRVLRHPVRLKVVEINGTPVTEAYLLDVSPLGTLLEAPCALLPGDQVVFSFLLPDEEAATRLNGQVAWVKPAGTLPERYRLGLNFLKPNWWLPPACIQTLKAGEREFERESLKNLAANHLQALEQITGVVGKLTAEIQELKQEVAQLASQVQELRRGCAPPHLPSGLATSP